MPLKAVLEYSSCVRTDGVVNGETRHQYLIISHTVIQKRLN